MGDAFAALTKRIRNAKVLSGNYVILSPKLSEDQKKKKAFIAIWDYIRPEFEGFIRADRPFFV